MRCRLFFVRVNQVLVRLCASVAGLWLPVFTKVKAGGLGWWLPERWLRV
jgi:hypothetical protein